jgi:hypothetical protein
MSGGIMKKHAGFVPLELSGSELEEFVIKLRDRLFSEFWPNFVGSPEEKKIKARIEKNIYSAFGVVPK